MEISIHAMKVNTIRVLATGILVFFAGLLVAQEPDSAQAKKGGFGGPDQVERQLEDDKADKDPFFELGFIQPYFDFKDRLYEKSGLNYSLDYSAAYFGASTSPGEKSASSGMVRLYASWELLGKGAKNTGALNFKVEHRHKYGAIPPQSLGFELGYVGMILPPFSDQGFRMTNLYWRQRFAGGRISMMAGLLDATDYVDVYGLASPWMHFTNFAFSTGSETVYIPNDAGLGVAVGAYITDHIYTIAGITDAGADPTNPLKSFETFFSNNDYFTSVELGWVSSKDRYFFDNIHLSWWHSDGSEVTASLSGWGLAFSGTWFFQDKIMPFLRGGYAKDGGTLLQKSVTAGVGYYFAGKGNVLGAAIGWGEVNESTWASGLEDQVTTEVFYRLQISTHFALTPTIQFLVNPALNPDASSIFLGGIRGRLTL